MSAAQPNLDILIPSCDGYSDLWLPFLNLWQRHWPDCPFKLYLGAEKAECSFPGVSVVRAPLGAKWSDCLHAFLDQTSSDFVLLCLEDFFLRQRVSTARVLTLFEQLQRSHGHCMRLVPRPPPAWRNRLPGAAGIGLLPPGAAYRVSTQAAIWRRDSLVKLLQPGDSAWQFELESGARADRLFPDGFFGVYRSALPYGHHVVERGKWFPWEAWRYRRMQIGCDFSRRETMPAGAAMVWLLRKMKDILLAPMPSKLRTRLRTALPTSSG